MKRFPISWLLALSLTLALVFEQVHAAQQGNGQQQQQQMTAPAQNAPATTPTRTQPTTIQLHQQVNPNNPPSTVLTKPSGVLDKPSGVLNIPTGVLNKPSGVLVKPSGVISPLPAESSSPKQNFVGGQRNFPQTPHMGDRNHDGDSRRGDHDSHGFRRRRTNYIVVYVSGAPYWYPVYTDYPYYDAPLAPTYDSGYYNGPSYIPTVADNSSGVTPAGSNYAEVGRQWGQDLRREIATWDQFVDYVRNYIVGASPAAQADFREAFITSYGMNGAAAYDKAAEQAVKVAG